MNEITAKWTQTDTKDTTLSTMTKIKTLHFAEDKVVIVDSDDNLQVGLFTLQNAAKNCGMEISPEKSETTEFLGRDPVRCKIVVDNKFFTSKQF